MDLTTRLESGPIIDTVHAVIIVIIVYSICVEANNLGKWQHAIIATRTCCQGDYPTEDLTCVMTKTHFHSSKSKAAYMYIHVVLQYWDVLIIIPHTSMLNILRYIEED